MRSFYWKVSECAQNTHRCQREEAAELCANPFPNQIQETNDRIRQVLQDRYESTQDALRILEETPLRDIDLDEAVEGFDEDGYAEADEFSMADASEGASQPAQTPPMAQDLPSKSNPNQ